MRLVIKLLINLVVVGAIVLQLAACTPVSDTKTAASAYPLTTWINENTLRSEQLALAENFQSLIDNADLRSLIVEALDNNRDLASTALQVESLRHTYLAQSRARLPGVQLQASHHREKTQRWFEDSPFIEQHRQFGLLMDWEIDLWGRLAAQARAQQASWQAASWELEGARRSLVAAVIRQWIALTAQARQQQLEQQRIALLTELNAVIVERYRTGLENYAAVAAAHTALLEAEGQYAAIEQQQQLAHSALAALLGRLSTAIDLNIGELPALPRLSIKTPAWVLADRPDVQAAWQTYLAVSHQQRAEHRALLPKLVIDASLIRSGDSWSALRNAPGLWSFVGGLNFIPAQLPFLSGAAQRDRARGAEFERRAQWQAYEGKVLQAIHEVEELFIRDLRLDERVSISANALLLERKLLADQKLGFDTGLIDVTTYYEAQLNVIARQLSHLDLTSLLIENRINLALALGVGLGDALDTHDV